MKPAIIKIGQDVSDADGVVSQGEQMVAALPPKSFKLLVNNVDVSTSSPSLLA